MRDLTFGSLFAGIGGFDLGFERAGLKCSWQVEIDDNAKRVLRKHWPTIRQHGDVRTFPPGNAGEWGVDIICGGFPCQDVSDAGNRAGLRGKRSGLWGEFRRVIDVLQPRFVIIENVVGLLRRGIGTVLRDLAASGYDAEWDVLAASDFQAPHIRERLFIVAYRSCFGQLEMSDEPILSGELFSQQKEDSEAGRSHFTGSVGRSGKRLPPPGVCRMDDGLPDRVDQSRVGMVGNAVVPQVAEFIGRRIVRFVNEDRTKVNGELVNG